MFAACGRDFLLSRTPVSGELGKFRTCRDRRFRILFYLVVSRHIRQQIDRCDGLEARLAGKESKIVGIFRFGGSGLFKFVLPRRRLKTRAGESTGAISPA